MSESIRQKKFARLLQRELSEILQNKIEGLEKTIITVSSVRVTPDLSIARVYLTAYPDAQLPALIRYLNDETGSVRYMLAERIKDNVKSMPSLVFFRDDSLETANSIDQLLAKAKETESNQDEEELKKQYKDLDDN
jgi:ribosome-binding factor A